MEPLGSDYIMRAGIRVLVKGLEGVDLFLPLFCHVRIQQEGPYQTPNASAIILDFPTTKNVKNKFLFFINYQS